MSLTWFGWLFIGLTVAGLMVQIALIGKPREPLNAATVLTNIILNSFLLWGIIAVGTRSH